MAVAYPTDKIISISVFDPSIDPENVGPKWQSWLARFENYLVAIDVKQQARKKALLLYHAGDYVFSISQQIADESDDYNQLVKKLNKHFRSVSANQTNRQAVVSASKSNCAERNDKILDKLVEKLVDKLGETNIKELNSKKEMRQKNDFQKCTHCGRKTHDDDEVCPAKGKHCTKCSGPNHFANVCRSKNNEKGAKSNPADHETK